MNATHRNIASLQEAIDGEWLVLDEHIVAQKWAILEQACKPFFDISKGDIDAGKTTPRCINSMFGICDGVRVIPPLEIMSAYVGDRHGGYTELYVEQGAQKHPHLYALTFENSVDSMIEAFYTAFELPKKGCFWHGCYGRDYNLLYSARRLSAAIQQRLGQSPAGDDQETVDQPPGIRLIKHGGSFRLACLAAYPNGEFVDMNLSLEDGRLSTEPNEIVLPASRQHFY